MAQIDLSQIAGKLEPIDRPVTGRQIISVAAYGLIIVWINAYICRELFTVQAAHMNSMHGFWVALAKRGSGA